jgi:hypothetical protein
MQHLKEHPKNEMLKLGPYILGSVVEIIKSPKKHINSMDYRNKSTV